MLVFGGFGVVIWLYMAYSDIASCIKDLVNNVTQHNGVVINEYLIERYVRFRETLDKTTQALIRNYISTYSSAAALEQFYTQFYEEYDRSSAKLPSKAEALVANIFEG